MRSVIRIAFAVFFLTLTTATGVLAGQHLVIGAMESGTVLWELEAMRTLGFDNKHDLDIEVHPLADARAGQIALQSGAVDLILSDFVYVSIQRNHGNNLTFVPHSLAVGGLVVDPAAGIRSIADLKGKILAISGSPVDKSWTILQAYYNHETGRTLTDDATVRFGAPPLVNELIASGQAQASLNLWNWNARAKLAGKTEVLSVWDMLKALGVTAQPPLLGWVFTDTTASTKNDTLKAFFDASFDTKAALLTDDRIWIAIRPQLGVKDDDRLFDELQEDYRAGIVRNYDPDNIIPAEEAYALMAKYGGPDVVGSSPSLAPGTFWTGYRRE
jgi:NitT/TauT family transport system substrate-binding protein